MDNRKLTDMIDFFRNKLAEEQLRHADAQTDVIALKRQLEENQVLIEDLQNQIEGYNAKEEKPTGKSTATK